MSAPAPPTAEPVTISEPEQVEAYTSATTQPQEHEDEAVDIADAADEEEGEEEEEDPDMIRVQNIPTLAQMYKEGLLKAAAKEKVKRGVEKGLLERVSLFRGDITRLQVDAIVNAANKSLLGGGGVDGAIHNAAGPKLLAECRQLNGCLTGESKITRGYNLPSAHVIHTVGPIYSTYGAEEKAAQLESCYKTSLQLAAEHSLRHIAFPCVSTGIYGYPIEEATHIALRTVRDFITSEQGSKIERAIFVIWNPRDKTVYEELLPEYFPLEESA